MQKLFDNIFDFVKKFKLNKDLAYMLSPFHFDRKNALIEYDGVYLILKDAKLYSIGEISNISDIASFIYKHNLIIETFDSSAKNIILELEKLYNFKIEDNKILETNIKKAIFSGGCFWCMAHPYYDFKGVKEVISGYTGGNSLNPTYLETKHGNGHRESVMIIYDSNVISYESLLKLYFESINPFEKDGQFIDKGHSYSTCVYYKNEEEKNIFNKYKSYIEKLYNMPVYVALEEENIFYEAEIEHQNFEFKNRKRFEEEEKISKRESYDFIKFDNIKIESLNEDELSSLKTNMSPIWFETYNLIIPEKQINFLLDKYFNLKNIYSYINDGYKYCKIVLNNTVLGYLVYKDNPNYVYLDKLYLYSEYRGFNIPKHVYDYLFSYKKNIRLNVNKANTRAYKNYIKNGFRIIKEETIDLGDNMINNDLVLEKDFE